MTANRCGCCPLEPLGHMCPFDSHLLHQLPLQGGCSCKPKLSNAVEYSNGRGTPILYWRHNKIEGTARVAELEKTK